MRKTFLAAALWIAFWSHLDGEEVSITLLHTTDLHANILPTTDYSGNTNVGGAARCASMIQKIRSENKNVLLVDAGDLYQGTALGYVTEGSVMIRTINHLRYESWTLGNHEFDWGLDKIAARIQESQVPVLAANLHHTPTPSTPSFITAAFKKVQPYIIREIQGIKIGIVGLTTPGIPNWSRPRLIPGIRIEDSVSALKRVLPEMKSKGCKILILVTHQAIRESGDDHANQIFAISRRFPEIDVIVGGHSHQLRKEQNLNGILYSQANYWGTYLGRVDLIYDTEKQKLLSKKGNAIPMDEKVPLSAELLDLLKDDLEKTENMLKTKIGESADTFHSLTGPKKETPIFNLIAASIAEALESRGEPVDGVIHGILNDRSMWKPGPITMEDVFQVVPYENTVGVVQLTRDELWEILEENASAYSGGRFRGIWGMFMKLKPSAPPGQRVLFIGNRKGESLTPDSRVRVAFNSYELASGGTRWKRLREIAEQPNSRLKEYDFQTRDALIEYVRKHSPLKASSHGWWSIERKSEAKGEKL